jgi:hypothetical protein
VLYLCLLYVTNNSQHMRRNNKLSFGDLLTHPDGAGTHYEAKTMKNKQLYYKFIIVRVRD